MLRVTGAALAALGLLSFAIIGGEESVGAQEAGVGIRLGDLSNYPTHLTVDRFLVELTNLTATEEYRVTVSSDSIRVGIGGCGTASQTQTETVTAEVRRTGASSPEATVSQRLLVEAIPENAIGARGERVRAPAAGAVPKVGTPGSVPNTYFSHKYLTSVRANWEKPSDGGRELTGFGLLFWPEADGHPGYDDPLLKGKDARNHPYTNLQRDTTYNFQIHACNGPDSCGYWTVPIVEVETGGPPKKPHTIRFDDPVGTYFFTVRWSPEADTGGPDMVLSGFGILVREIGSVWPSDSETRWVGASARAYTESGLDAGRSYVVKVKSCNGDGGRTSCSDWSADSRVRTAEVELTIPSRPVVSNPVVPECPFTPDTATPPGGPQNLDVTPSKQGMLTVCWSPVRDARRYEVQATHLIATLLTTTAWFDARAADGVLTTTENHFTIDLDEIIEVSGTSLGLADEPAFGLRVGAIDDDDDKSFSSPILIVDTPITMADGKSDSGADSGTGKIEVKWKPITGILGDAYNNGQYDLRYRKSKGSISGSPWAPDYFDDPGDPVENKQSPHTIEHLHKSAVYAIQLFYRNAGPSGNTNVFSARYAFAWTSDSPPANGSILAGVPVTSRIDDTTFSYKICTSTFLLGGRTGDWVNLMAAAFGRWQTAVTTDLITIRRDTEP